MISFKASSRWLLKENKLRHSTSGGLRVQVRGQVSLHTLHLQAWSGSSAAYRCCSPESLPFGRGPQSANSPWTDLLQANKGCQMLGNDYCLSAGMNGNTFRQWQKYNKSDRVYFEVKKSKYVRVSGFIWSAPDVRKQGLVLQTCTTSYPESWGRNIQSSTSEEREVRGRRKSRKKGLEGGESRLSITISHRWVCTLAHLLQHWSFHPYTVLSLTYSTLECSFQEKCECPRHKSIELAFSCSFLQSQKS